jgi:hypothetical protein
LPTVLIQVQADVAGDSTRERKLPPAPALLRAGQSVHLVTMEQLRWNTSSVQRILDKIAVERERFMQLVGRAGP